MPESDFGARVIGEEKVAFHKQQSVAGNLVFGNRVVDGVAAVETPAPQVPALHPSTEGMSVVTIKKLLTEEPQQFDKLLAQELQRPDTRRGALSAFRAAEQRREGGPREAIVTQIDRRLA